MTRPYLQGMFPGVSETPKNVVFSIRRSNHRSLGINFLGLYIYETANYLVIGCINACRINSYGEKC